MLDEWTPGPTLARCIERAAQAEDRSELRRLADAFDRLAADLLAASWAHGDLKPENIVRTPDGTLRPIDFDAMFLPELAGQPASELGTAAYQHPARTTADFDRHLDDFPAALIATALHALALDPTMWRRYGDRDGLLFDPVRLVRGDDPSCAEALARFAREGDAAAYRIARLLHSPFLRLPELGRLLDWRLQCADTERDAPDPADLTLDVEAGRWGFRLGERWAILPLYDSGFDFSEGLAAVRLGGAWHFIDPAGRVRINCAGWSAVRPFRRGRATLVRAGERREIARSVTEGVENPDSFCYICPP